MLRKGLEPSSQRHTHLKRTCIPIPSPQHHNDLTIVICSAIARKIWLFTNQPQYTVLKTHLSSISYQMFKTLLQDYKLAMKTKSEPKKSVLNYLLAQIKNKTIELQREPNDEEILSLIKKEVKSIQESLSFLQKTNKSELIQEELTKKAILESYLPTTLNEKDSRILIQQTIKTLGITDLKSQRGLLIKTLIEKYKHQIDPTLINQLINTML